MVIAELKYPKEKGWCHVWIFDHSSCHAAMADNALDAAKMNVNPGGKQRKMRDTVWKDAVLKMNDSRGVPKAMARVLTASVKNCAQIPARARNIALLYNACTRNISPIILRTDT